MRGPPSRPPALVVVILIAACAFVTPARAQDGKEALGASVEGLLAVSRQLSPSLRDARQPQLARRAVRDRQLRARQ